MRSMGKPISSCSPSGILFYSNLVKYLFYQFSSSCIWPSSCLVLLLEIRDVCGLSLLWGLWHRHTEASSVLTYPAVTTCVDAEFHTRSRWHDLVENEEVIAIRFTLVDDSLQTLLWNAMQHLATISLECHWRILWASPIQIAP